MAHRISLGGLKIQFFSGGLNSYLERALLEYIRQIKAPRVTRPKSEKIQTSQPRKAKKIEEKRVLTRQPIAEVDYEDSQPQRQSGEISSAALRLINNSDFD
jgi:hypothetical protein